MIRLMYYYAYYLLSKFAKRFNNSDGDFAFTAIFYYLILFTLNILTVMPMMCDKVYLKSHKSLVIFVSTTIPILIHYFFLVNNKKYLNVIELYDAKVKGTFKDKTIAVIFCVYVIITFISVIYMAHLVRGSW